MPIGQINDETLHCVRGHSLALITDVGMWQTDDRGASWRQVGSPFSTPGYVVRWNGDLFSGQRFGATWVEPAGESAWRGQAHLRGTPQVDDPGRSGTRTLTRDGSHLYATIEGENLDAHLQDRRAGLRGTAHLAPIISLVAHDARRCPGRGSCSRHPFGRAAVVHLARPRRAYEGSGAAERANIAMSRCRCGCSMDAFGRLF